jgi:hypothetical protein
MDIQLWTIPQAVEFLRSKGLEDVNEKWISNRCDRGQIPYTVLGRKRRVRSDVMKKIVAEWIREAA